MTTADLMPLWISEAEVVSLMDMGQAIAALENGLQAEAQGQAQNLVKTHVEWGGGTLHAIGATFPQAGFAGTKTWAHTAGGATPLLILFDSNNGALKAIIEAFALGQMRTASASGLATQWLAAPDAAEFALLGTGKQAITQLAAVLAVRPIRRVRAYSPNQEHCRNFVAHAKSELGVEAIAAATAREAVAGAPIITVVTRAKDPVLTADMVSRGAHINAVGAIIPSRAEVAPDVVARATRIVADSVPQAQKLSRELIEVFGSDSARWERVQSLAGVVAARRPRSADDDVTLFKSLGMGVSDLALGIELYKMAVESGLGHKFSHPLKISPQLLATHPARSRAGG